jgi:hypothetical protein
MVGEKSIALTRPAWLNRVATGRLLATQVSTRFLFYELRPVLLRAGSAGDFPKDLCALDQLGSTV